MMRFLDSDPENAYNSNAQRRERQGAPDIAAGRVIELLQVAKGISHGEL